MDEAIAAGHGRTTWVRSHSAASSLLDDARARPDGRHRSCAAARAAAQADVGEIRLVVKGVTDAPVVASGTLASEAPPMRRSFTTDAEGRFTLSRVPFGVYVVTIEAAGYAARQLTVDVRSARPYLVSVSLVATQRLQQSVST